MANVNIRIEAVKTEEQQTGVPTQKASDKKGGADVAVASIFAHQAISVTKSIVSSYSNNIGLFTGNYVKQDNMQRTMEAIGTLTSVGVAFATNWVAGIAMVAGLGIKSIVDYSVQQREIELENKKVEYLRERNGNTLVDGSRRR